MTLSKKTCLFSMTSWEQFCGLKMLARSKTAKVRQKMLSHQDLKIQGANNNIEVGVGKVTGNSAAWNLGHSFSKPLASKRMGKVVVFLLPGFSEVFVFFPDCRSTSPFGCQGTWAATLWTPKRGDRWNDRWTKTLEIPFFLWRHQPKDDICFPGTGWL